MKVATLLTDRASEKIALSALSGRGVSMSAFADIGALVGGLQDADFAAVVLEDGPNLPAWLATLAVHLTASVAKIAVGTAEGLSRALYSGADDYAVLNDGGQDLFGRIQALRLSRQDRIDQRMLRIGPFSLDADMLAMQYRGQAIALTSREFQLAWILFANPGRVVSTRLVANSLWSRPPEDCKRSIEQYMYRLRRKISGAQIHAVYGVGYRLELRDTTTE